MFPVRPGAVRLSGYWWDNEFNRKLMDVSTREPFGPIRKTFSQSPSEAGHYGQITLFRFNPGSGLRVGAAGLDMP